MPRQPTPTFSDEAARLPAPATPSPANQEMHLLQKTIQTTPAILAPLLARFGVKCIVARQNKLLAQEQQNETSFHFWSAMQDAYQEELDWLTEGTAIGPPMHTSVHPTPRSPESVVHATPPAQEP